ncbi:hypothetical protein J2I47_15175 [Fibrella sp. HMF5335]|uniref:Uncharacterized protein n=1 Tax=Fibrella rubiginis TaxID=2817060 RepID=A0A939K5L6_9BACT|nr:hypothetical protein [Fibrella rubiginis]MBO0937898.1 hypothetical protein [Fibrella rubiginis]
MQDIEPFYGWEKYYAASDDERSPFYERTYNTTQYENDIYGYYIHPYWDEIGSETLYCKILYANYDRQAVVIELFGEWNDTLHNDIMFLKRQVIDPLVHEGVKYFLLIGENVLNFHGSDDSYYEEWFDDVEDGWITAINFPEFVETEWIKFRLDYYINFGGTLHIPNWRTLKPMALIELVNGLVVRRLG